jgi:hypothetical protein
MINLEPTKPLMTLGNGPPSFFQTLSKASGMFVLISQSLAKFDYWYSPLLKVIHFPLQNLPQTVLSSKTYYTIYSTCKWIILLYVMKL